MTSAFICVLFFFSNTLYNGRLEFKRLYRKKVCLLIPSYTRSPLLVYTGQHPHSRPNTTRLHRTHTTHAPHTHHTQPWPRLLCPPSCRIGPAPAPCCSFCLSLRHVDTTPFRGDADFYFRSQGVAI